MVDRSDAHDRSNQTFMSSRSPGLEREDSVAAAPEEEEEEKEEEEAEEAAEEAEVVEVEGEELADTTSTISGASTVSGGRSNVWNHFKIIDNKAQCFYCQ